jgi:hypothetical protein
MFFGGNILTHVDSQTTGSQLASSHANTPKNEGACRNCSTCSPYNVVPEVKSVSSYACLEDTGQ